MRARNLEPMLWDSVLLIWPGSWTHEISKIWSSKQGLHNHKTVLQILCAAGHESPGSGPHVTLTESIQRCLVLVPALRSACSSSTHPLHPPPNIPVCLHRSLSWILGKRPGFCSKIVSSFSLFSWKVPIGFPYNLPKSWQYNKYKHEGYLQNDTNTHPGRMVNLWYLVD